MDTERNNESENFLGKNNKKKILIDVISLFLNSNFLHIILHNIIQ